MDDNNTAFWSWLDPILSFLAQCRQLGDGSFYTRLVPESIPTKVGLFGGTFDPPHLGHLRAAQAAARQVGLEEIFFVVANEPWQKTDQRAVTPAALRAEMVEQLLMGHRGLRVDDREIRRGGASYSADTLEEMHTQRPDVEIFLIVGQDAATTMASSWHRPEVIFALSTVVVVTRPGEPLQNSTLPSDSIYVEMNPVDISSSHIRHLVSQGESIAHLTTDGVARCIEAHDLYRGAM
jgi:nicotinate-nucleotide adenylyltransferase